LESESVFDFCHFATVFHAEAEVGGPQSTFEDAGLARLILSAAISLTAALDE
jgi:hypothetical protein